MDGTNPENFPVEMVSLRHPCRLKREMILSRVVEGSRIEWDEGRKKGTCCEGCSKCNEKVVGGSDCHSESCARHVDRDGV